MQEEAKTLYELYKEWMSETDTNKLTFDGLDILNEAIGGGFGDQTLNLVVAEPGFGKTNFMIFQMLQFALFGAKTIFVSCEMTKAKLVPRMVANIAKIPVWQVMKWKEEGKYKEVIETAEKILEVIPLKILFTQNIEEIYEQSLNLRLDGYKHIFIDHFSELMTGHIETAKINYTKEMYFVDIFKNMYKENGFTIFLACQFKKPDGVQGVQYGLRTKSDILGVSQLVQTASTVIYLYETKKMEAQREMNFINKMSDASSGCVLKLLKAREGIEGRKIKLDYFRSSMQFKLPINQIIE